MTSSADRSTFLRRSLPLDGLALGLCGALLFVAAPTIAAPLGIAGMGIPPAVGAGLLVFAAALLWNASRARASRAGAFLTVALNATWVMGSLILVVDGPLTVIGNVAVAVIAVAVFRLPGAGGDGPASSPHRLSVALAERRALAPATGAASARPPRGRTRRRTAGSSDRSRYRRGDPARWGRGWSRT
jgi:hypothetical protein